jgi:hypothetical protein
MEQKQYNQFATITINNLLSQGEHIRIINDSSTIWEVFGTNNDLLNEGEAYSYAVQYVDASTSTTLNSTTFSTKGTIEQQTTALESAFNTLTNFVGTPFYVGYKSSNIVSLIIRDEYNATPFQIQRITSQTLNNPIDINSGFNTTADASDMIFFGVCTPSEEEVNLIVPIGSEIFGARRSFTYSFIDRNNSYLFSIDSSVANNIEEHMLYTAIDSRNKKFLSFDVSNNQHMYVLDPINSDGNILLKGDDQPYVIKSKMNGYAVYPLTVSLMGINPVKDLDYTVYDSELDENYKSQYWYKREDDEDCFNVVTDTSLIITTPASFEITTGTGSITIGNVKTSYSSPFVFNCFSNYAFIEASTLTIISHQTLSATSDFKSYKSGATEEDINSYKSSSTKLKYPLTVPYVTKWAGVGNDVRNNPLRFFLDSSLMDTNDIATNFIPYGGQYHDEISLSSFKYLSQGTRAHEQYVYADINDVLFDGSTYQTFKEYMLANPTLDVFSKFVYSSNEADSANPSTIAYYNLYKNAIDFITSGLNISLSVVPVAEQTFNIKEYDKYRVAFVSTPSRNRESNYPMEVILNENTGTILIVWYQGADLLHFTNRYSLTTQGKNILSGFGNPDFLALDDSWPYNYAKTPFTLNTTVAAINTIDRFAFDQDFYSYQMTPYAQLNINKGAIYGSSMYNAYNSNSVTTTLFNDYGISYNTFYGNVYYTYVPKVDTINNNVLNSGYTYSSNQNLYDNNVCDASTLSYILTNNLIFYRIMKEDITYTNNDFYTPPLKLTINQPRKYKDMYTYNGWYRPMFKDILKFKISEDKQIQNIVGLDFTMANTKLSSYNNIDQIWFNKVVETVTAQDVSDGNAIKHATFNPFLSQWDNYYYTLDEFDLEPGYKASMELPSFFGSKLPKFPSTITFDTWNSNTVNVTQNIIDNTYTFKFNITKSLLEMFKNNSTFIKNWNGLTISDSIINNYISKTVLSYYQIDNGSIKTEMFRKAPKVNNILSYIYDNTYTQYNEANVDGVLTFINNEYIYNITVKETQYNYYVRLKLFEK